MILRDSQRSNYNDNVQSVPGLSPASRWPHVRESRRVRSKASPGRRPPRTREELILRRHIRSCLSSRAASCSPPAWPRGAATSRGERRRAEGSGDEPRRRGRRWGAGRWRATSRPVTYATNYSAETTCGSERRACLPTEDTGNSWGNGRKAHSLPTGRAQP
jgi:hypothetical protein